jgi:hypothetical protein
MKEQSHRKMETKRWLKGYILVLRILSCGKACIKAKQSNSMYAGEKAETKKKKITFHMRTVDLHTTCRVENGL